MMMMMMMMMSFFYCSESQWRIYSGRTDVCIVRPQRQLAIAAYCYRRSSLVGVSVCLCVGHVREPCENGIRWPLKMAEFATFKGL